MKYSLHYFLQNLVLIVLGLMSSLSCKDWKKEKQVALYRTYCASCHLAPSIQDLPKGLWEKSVLPDMAARMGIRTEDNHPYKDLTFHEQEAIIKSGVYPVRPIIEPSDWQLLKEYIISMAPESITDDATQKTSVALKQFAQIPITLDSTRNSLITYLDFDGKETLHTGTMRGILGSYNLPENQNVKIGQYGSPISDAHITDNDVYVTAMGTINPSEIASGHLFKDTGSRDMLPIIEGLHRPVHSLFHDLNGNGKQEIIISEFGDLAGRLTLFFENEDGAYERKILMGQPGTIKVVAKDMNKDGKTDLIALSSQGDEGISILYQRENLNFTNDKVLRFSPLYGTSWFELVDYDGDGDDDIITVHGDNADDTYIQKPYHGMRIHLNNGENSFEETYFYPLNGATRVIVKDFDQDDDMDIALLSTFPDYERYPEFSFVYLQNNNAKTYDFSVQTLKDPALGRWFLMDSGDVDQDGDQDIILSAFTYNFTPVPKALQKQWNTNKTDILILENNSVKEKS